MWVSKIERLRSLVDEWVLQPRIAVDTEFIRVETFYPVPALVQLAIADQAWLIDPLAVKRPEVLARVFYSQDCLKVIHACYEDLEVIERLTQLSCRHIFDTQLGAAYMGMGPQIGYQRLVQEMLGVHVDKEESRSDWLQRPLSSTQLHYALQDVAHLLPIHRMMQEQLQAKGHWERISEDHQLMLLEREDTVADEELYTQVTNAWKLKPRNLHVLRALCIWREHEARRRDLPRSFLIRHNSLLLLAQQLPLHRTALSLIEGMTPRILRREGDAILEVIKNAAADPVSQFPPVLPLPWPREIQTIHAAIRALVNQVAEGLQLPADIVVRKRHLDDLIECYLGVRSPTPRWLGWRHEVIYTPIMALLKQHDSEIRTMYQVRHGSV